MDKKPKELTANSDADDVKVFVRPSPHELEQDDLEHVAGGARGHWDPNG